MEKVKRNNNDLPWRCPGVIRATRKQSKDLSIRINKSGKSALALVFRFHNAAHLRIDPTITRVIFAHDITTDRLYFDSALAGYALTPANRNIALNKAENTQFTASTSAVDDPTILVGEYTLLYDGARQLYYIDLTRG